MKSPSIFSKKRIVFLFLSFSIVSILLIFRIGFIQLIIGDKLKKEAFEQWSRDIPIKAKRGIIYDRNGKILATNINLDTVWVRPSDIKDPRKTAKVLSEILEIDKNKIFKLITKKQSIVEIARWISKDKADRLREIKLQGIEIVDDNKRYYPYNNFASQLIGHTNIDNVGQNGLEMIFNDYLTGTPGRWMKTVDAKGNEMPYKEENLIMPEQGFNLHITLDETIQSFAEKKALETLIKNKAKKVSIIMMEPKTGDILAMVTKPDYDLNNVTDLLYNPLEPWKVNSKDEIINWRKVKWADKKEFVFSNWKNFPISSIYEPGSTFKIITAITGLDKGVVKPDSKFYCDGFVRKVNSKKPIKCWRYYRPHGNQTFIEGVQNSCNEVFVEVGLRIGAEDFYKYIRKFGFGDKTSITLPGEIKGIVPHFKYIKEVNLATMSFGQGIAVTPIQLVTAVSAIANEGKLMKPRIVKAIENNNGEIVKEFEPEIVRKVVSKEKANEMLKILESVVSEGTGGRAYQEGYRIGGKTGTAQKVIDGKYAIGKYISSFIGVAPVDDPKVVALVVIDEPTNGIYYGGQIAAPVIGELIKETLDYLDVELKYYNKTSDKKVKVPDLRNKTIKEASKILDEKNIKYYTETTDVQSGTIIRNQFPLPGTMINKGQIVYLYVNN